MGTRVQDISVDRAVCSMAALNSGDPILEDIANILALLLLTKLISIGDWVVVRVCGIISFPSLH